MYTNLQIYAIILVQTTDPCFGLSRVQILHSTYICTGFLKKSANDVNNVQGGNLDKEW